MLLSGTSLMFSVGLTFSQFKGESDGGVAFKHQPTPFCLIETGYSDSGRLTRSRAMHWIVHGQPGVNVPAVYILIFTGKNLSERQSRLFTTTTNQSSNSSLSISHPTSSCTGCKSLSPYATIAL